MTYAISMITGDGVGPELASSAHTILDAISGRLHIKFDVTDLAAGDSAISDGGDALPSETIQAIKDSDACLKAPVGESAADVIVRLRRLLDLYANIRPAVSYPGVPSLRDDIDMVIVRENTEDLYTGQEFVVDGGAVALRIVTEAASRRIAVRAFEMARLRRKQVTCVHKSNVMRVTDGLFRRVCEEVSTEYTDVSLEHMYVDACAMNIIRQPHLFDTIVTTNLFGDILSDESSQVVGGLGMAPAANIGDDFALFEPVHGAAFDIAGRGQVNPSSFILSIKMMLEWLAATHNDDTCGRAALRLESSLVGVIKGGQCTVDIGGDLSTAQFTAAVAGHI